MFTLFSGADEFSMHEELARLRAAGGFEFNQDVFSGADADQAMLETIRNTCETLPFLTERRLVVVEGLPKPKRGARGEDDGSEEDGEPASAPEPARTGRGKKAKGGTGPKAFAQGLAGIAAHLPQTTELVMLVPEPLDAANPLVRAAQAHGKARVFNLPRGTQLEEWLVRRAKSRDARLASDAARLLVSTTGEDLRLLAGEIDKLSAYAGKGGEIRAEDVQALTPVARQARVFDLTDALARRDRSRALALLHELLAQGESPLGIVALTAFQTRALLQVKLLAERGVRAGQIAQTAGLAPFVVEKSLPLARQFTVAQLEAAHRALLDVDTALKRSRLTPELALDLLVLEFGKSGTVV